MAVRDVLDLLACPHCRLALTLSVGGGSVRCAQGHSFDLARQGYVNLTSSRAPRNADTAAMVVARERFLSSGAYEPVADRLLEIAQEARTDAPRLLEVGAGTAYYLARLLTGLEGSRGVALDVSVAAARRAASAHVRLGSVVADAWQRIPAKDGVVDVLLNVFAPRNPDEFHRVLSPSGLVLCVTPEPEHLVELRTALGLLNIQADKHEQLKASLGERFTERSSESLHLSLALDPWAVRDLVAMGPNAFHLTEADIAAQVGSLPRPFAGSAALNISVWQPRA